MCVVVRTLTSPLSNRVKQKRPAERRDVFVFRSLDLVDVKGVWALWALTDFERNLVTLIELFERNVLELV
jgi:hypothetical protein